MLKIQQNQPESSLICLVDNLDFKRDLDDNEYIVLIKKQPDKPYSTLYLTDCEDNFWLKKIDVEYVESLKNELKLKTSTQTFIKCLLKGLKDNCQIIVPDQDDLLDPSKDYPKLQVRLQIGEGLTMTSFINFNANLNREKDEKGHKIILKLFLRQLYESKDSKQRSIAKQVQALKRKKDDEEKSQAPRKDNKFVSELFNIIHEEKKDPTKNLKHRDLLNPNRQKRKHAGVKLSTPI